MSNLIRPDCPYLSLILQYTDALNSHFLWLNGFKYCPIWLVFRTDIFLTRIPDFWNKRPMGLWRSACELGHWPKFQADMGWCSNLPYLGMKLCHWQKFQKLHIYFVSTPGGQWSLFLIQWRRFPIYASIFEIAIFGHGTWPSRNWTSRLCLPQGGENWAYFRSTGSGFQDMGRFSQLPYLGMKLGHNGQSSRS